MRTYCGWTKSISHHLRTPGMIHSMAMGHKSQIVPPSEHPNPTTKMGSKMGGEFTYQPKWDPKTVLTTTAISGQTLCRSFSEGSLSGEREPPGLRIEACCALPFSRHLSAHFATSEQKEEKRAKARLAGKPTPNPQHVMTLSDPNVTPIKQSSPRWCGSIVDGQDPFCTSWHCRLSQY